MTRLLMKTNVDIPFLNNLNPTERGRCLIDLKAVPTTVVVDMTVKLPFYSLVSQ